jgi:hypothetical protein
MPVNYSKRAISPVAKEKMHQTWSPLVCACASRRYSLEKYVIKHGFGIEMVKNFIDIQGQNSLNGSVRWPNEANSMLVSSTDQSTQTHEMKDEAHE